MSRKRKRSESRSKSRQVCEKVERAVIRALMTSEKKLKKVRQKAKQRKIDVFREAINMLLEKNIQPSVYLMQGMTSAVTGAEYQKKNLSSYIQLLALMGVSRETLDTAYSIGITKWPTQTVDLDTIYVPAADT